jgi:hypothetical protein
MPIRDPIGNLCDCAVRVHIRLVESVNFDVLLAVRLAQQVYGRWGIFFDAASLQTVHLERPDREYFATLITACERDGYLGKQDDLYQLFGVQDLCSITVFLIGDIMSIRPRADSAVVGCAAHSRARPAVFIDRAAGPGTLAHEVGHVLIGSGHEFVETNLMNGVDARSIATPRLTPRQVHAIRRSPYVRGC